MASQSKKNKDVHFSSKINANTRIKRVAFYNKAQRRQAREVAYAIA